MKPRRENATGPSSKSDHYSSGSPRRQSSHHSSPDPSLNRPPPPPPTVTLPSSADAYPSEGDKRRPLETEINSLLRKRAICKHETDKGFTVAEVKPNTMAYTLHWYHLAAGGKHQRNQSHKREKISTSRVAYPEGADTERDAIQRHCG